MLKCIEAVLDASGLERAVSLVEQGRFVDGWRTAGERARRVKRNLQLDRSGDGRRELNEMVREALLDHREFRRFAYPRFVADPLISRYEPGMEYGAHVDDALMGRSEPVRSDLAVTVFLCGPESYDGGELYVGQSYGEIAVKLPAGDAVVYAANTIHRVAPVTRGERLAAVTWVQSYVRDPFQREVLADLDRIKRALRERAPDAEETDLAAKTLSNLLRMWAEV